MNVVQTGSPPSSFHRLLVVGGFVVLVFCTGTAEYLIAEVLPQVSADLSVSVATAVQTVTAYALGVSMGGPLVTVLTARLPRKGLALVLGGVFLVGTVLTALAPTYGWMIVGRVVSACSQATLFAIALTTSTAILGTHRQGQAIAIVGSVLTAATVLGVPLGVLVGGATSWRMPFVLLSIVTAAGMVCLAISMPRTPGPPTGAADEVRTLVRGPVLLAVATTVVGFAGVSVVFTYLVPLLQDVTGLPASTIPALLLAYGGGGFIGNLIAGRLADRSLGATLIGILLGLAVKLGAFPILATVPLAMVILVLMLGLLSTATIAPLQSLVLRHASSAPTLSLAVNVAAFNLANAIGSALGGLGVAAGLMRWGGFGGTLFACAGMALSLIALRFPSSTHAPSPSQNDSKESAS